MTQNKFLRIGTDYYKQVDVPINETETVKKLIGWKKQTIIDDYGRDSIKEIESYEGFITIPSHINYKEKINGFYNQYEPIDYNLIEGDFPNTNQFLLHIFGDQYELGLDYITILWKKPKHILPILSLVSKERNTGKTTFLNWLKLIFGGNMTLNKNEDFRSQFNADWASKLIIAIDEVLLERNEDSERLKHLSTSQYFKLEGKGKDKIEIPFYGKFILCSNNEDNFVKVDPNEIRYWVRKIPVLQNSNPFLLQSLEKEVPYFMHFINKREIKTKKMSRMWFAPDLLKTEALRVLVKGNKTYLEKELIELLYDSLTFFDKETKELKYTSKDLSRMLRENGHSTHNHQISKFLKDKWNLDSVNGTYKMYHYSAYNSNTNSFIDYESKKGRYFTFSRELLSKL